MKSCIQIKFLPMKTIVLSTRVICMASVMQVATAYVSPGQRRNVTIVLYTAINGDTNMQQVIASRANHFSVCNNWKKIM